jgi:hypothetical protein
MVPKCGQAGVTWEANRQYMALRGRQCIVCDEVTEEVAAPMGILSGSLACHHDHEDKVILTAYLKWVQEVHEA